MSSSTSRANRAASSGHIVIVSPPGPGVRSCRKWPASVRWKPITRGPRRAVGVAHGADLAERADSDAHAYARGRVQPRNAQLGQMVGHRPQHAICDGFPSTVEHVSWQVHRAAYASGHLPDKSDHGGHQLRGRTGRTDICSPCCVSSTPYPVPLRRWRLAQPGE